MQFEGISIGVKFDDGVLAFHLPVLAELIQQASRLLSLDVKQLKTVGLLDWEIQKGRLAFD